MKDEAREVSLKFVAFKNNRRSFPFAPLSVRMTVVFYVMNFRLWTLERFHNPFWTFRRL